MNSKLDKNTLLFKEDGTATFKVIRHFYPYIRCSVKIIKNASIPKSFSNLVLTYNDGKKIHVRILSITINTRSHLTKNKRHVTGRCVLQEIK